MNSYIEMLQEPIERIGGVVIPVSSKERNLASCLLALHFQHYMAAVGSLMHGGNLAMSQGDNADELQHLLPAAAGIERRSFGRPGREESDNDGGVRGRS